MRKFMELFNLVNGRPLPEEELGEASRLRLVIKATLVSMAFAVVWGLAVGSSDFSLAVSNIYKLPMVLLLSALCALPASLLAWKMFGLETRSTDLVMGLATCNFAGTLVLAVLAPIVALYYHTSAHLGGKLAMAACFLAMVTGWVVLFRAVKFRTAEIVSFRKVCGPLLVLLLVHMAAVIQFIHIASPILPEVTVFDGGMDGVLGS